MVRDAYFDGVRPDLAQENHAIRNTLQNTEFVDAALATNPDLTAESDRKIRGEAVAWGFMREALDKAREAGVLQHFPAVARDAAAEAEDQLVLGRIEEFKSTHDMDNPPF